MRPMLGPSGRLDRADAAVVAVVDVADVEPGALSREAAGAEGGEPALARELRERVRLVHELRELAAAEELLHRRDDRADVDEEVRGGLLDLLDRHPLADDALHAEEADAERVLDELAIGADPAIAEVVDVIRGAEAVVELDEPADDRRDVLAGDGPAELRACVLPAGELDTHPRGDVVELLVELVPPHPTEIVAAEVEEEAVDELARVVAGRRVAGPQLLVDLDEGVVDRLGEVLLERRRDELVLGVRVHGVEERGDLVVGLVPDGPEERGRGDLPLPVHLDREEVLVARLELEPRPAVRDDLRAVQHAPGRRVLEGGVVDTGRTDELAHHDALRAVDDERALVRHPRVVAHVDALALDLAGLLDEELDFDMERLDERPVADPALVLGELRVAERVVEEPELHDLAGEVLDGADLVEELAQALRDEPVERLELELDEVRDREDLGDPRIRDAVRARGQVDRRVSRQHEPLLGGGRQGETGRAHGTTRIPRNLRMSSRDGGGPVVPARSVRAVGASRRRPAPSRRRRAARAAVVAT